MALLPNVAAARTVAESAMVDTCQVFRDPEGTGDDTLDEDTGILTPAPTDDDPIYDGPCMLTTAVRESTDGEGGALVYRRLKSARLPVSAPQLLYGDVLVVTVAANDPQLVGRRARVLDSEVNTFAVTRKLLLEDLAGSVVR